MNIIKCTCEYNTRRDRLEFKEIGSNIVIATIEDSHFQDCCEYNYADFKQIDDLAKSHVYNYEELHIEKSENKFGFEFGDNSRKFFVPCYSEQNGYYSADVDITLFKCLKYPLTKEYICTKGEWIDR